ncbi:MAG: winged helix-turn-helix domain-containing protein [Actinomycetota bacterium]
MGAGALPSPVLTDRVGAPLPSRRPRLLIAGGDRLRLDGLASDLATAGFEARSHTILEGAYPMFDIADPEAGWEMVILDLRSWTSEVIAWCQQARRERWLGEAPVVFLVGSDELRELPLREGLYDDFLESPYSLTGLAARLHLVRWRARRVHPDALQARELILEPHSYRVALRGVPLELTYMEFELLKFLMAHPTKVFTRETLLNRVWGYEYFGGVRTVDVHVRRLRAKLGEDHARLIETVRGVGYRFTSE